MSDQPTRTGWEIRPIGSLHTGWGLIFNGEIKASHPSAFVLGAYLDAKLKGAGDRDAWLIAHAMARRGWPTLEERMAVFTADGGPPPSERPFKS